MTYEGAGQRWDDKRRCQRRPAEDLGRHGNRILAGDVAPGDVDHRDGNEEESDLEES